MKVGRIVKVNNGQYYITTIGEYSDDNELWKPE